MRNKQYRLYMYPGATKHHDGVLADLPDQLASSMQASMMLQVARRQRLLDRQQPYQLQQ